MDLLIAGTIGLDSIETPFGRAADVLGGSATYASLAAGAFALPGIVSIAGSDFTDNHKEIFTGRGIDLQGLTVAPGKTFRWGGKYDFDLNNRVTLFTELNTLAEFNPLLPENYKKSKYVFLGNIDPVLQLQILNQLQNPEFVALDTMNYWMENKLAELFTVLPKVNAIIINDSEARELSKEFSIHKAAGKILGMMQDHPLPPSFDKRGKTSPEGRPPGKTLIIKRGEYGLQMFQARKIFNLPAFPVEDVFDPTGAGDSFAGAFVGYLSRSADFSWEHLKRACVAGSTAASFCVEKMGVLGLLDIDESKIKNRLAEFKRLTEFDMGAD